MSTPSTAAKILARDAPKPPAFMHMHPWAPTRVLASPAIILEATASSIIQQLEILDCRGHDARDMQRTLNYIGADLENRMKAEQARVQEGKLVKGKSRNRADKGLLGNDERAQQMEEADEAWEKKHGGNPKWGEGRARKHVIDGGEGNGKGLRERMRKVLMLKRAVRTESTRK